MVVLMPPTRVAEPIGISMPEGGAGTQRHTDQDRQQQYHDRDIVDEGTQAAADQQGQQQRQ